MLLVLAMLATPLASEFESGVGVEEVEGEGAWGKSEVRMRWRLQTSQLRYNLSNTCFSLPSLKY
jgi:hypothetical protein